MSYSLCFYTQFENNKEQFDFRIFYEERKERLMWRPRPSSNLSIYD